MSANPRHLVISAIYFVLGLLFTCAFYVRYWKWRDCIEQAASSCITPGGESLIAGGMLWAVPAVAFLASAAWRLVRALRP